VYYDTLATAAYIGPIPPTPAVKKKIYLAGLIHTNVQDTLNWRLGARAELDGDFEVLDPLRGKEHIYQRGGDSEADRTGGLVTTMMSPRALMQRDFADVRAADVILANLYDYISGRPLTGTIYELAWAWERHKPVVAFCPNGYWIREHPFVSETVSEWFTDHLDATDYIKKMWRGW
jgi:nucleoside 2-deoxyribosyltransferase